MLLPQRILIPVAIRYLVVDIGDFDISYAVQQAVVLMFE